MKLPVEFVALSQKIGADPLQVPVLGSNTLIKRNGPMWIKTGIKLAEAELRDGDAKKYRQALAKTES